MSNLKTNGDVSFDADRGVVNVSFDFNQEPRILNLANTEVAKSWTTVQIDWGYPTGEMLLIIETPFTEKKQPYAIALEKEWAQVDGLAVSRSLNGEETDVPASDSGLVQNSDGNGQVILKFKHNQGNAYQRTLKYKVIGK